MFFISNREILVFYNFSDILFTGTAYILCRKNYRICIWNTWFTHILHININSIKKDTLIWCLFIYQEPPPPPPPPPPDEPPPLKPLPLIPPELRVIPPFSYDGTVAFSIEEVNNENV